MEPPPDSDEYALQFLAAEGYLPLDLSDQPELLSAYSALFTQSSAFFALPEDDPQKTNFAVESGAAASEEGYSKIPDEKRIVTVKIGQNCPEILHARVREVWEVSGSFMKDTMEAIATTLHLDSKVFAGFVDPCVSLPQEDRTPSLLRMFRYDRPPGPDPIVNAERHKDLGLLSLVIGHSPGLQVLSQASKEWVPIEEDTVLPPGTKAASGGLTATLLAGETLAFLTRGAYRAGVHGVVCAPAPEGSEESYRYSIVFTLRPAVAPVYTKSFESDIVGTFSEKESVNGQSSADLFGQIKRAHYNVNVAPEVREKQKKGIGEEKVAETGKG